MSEKLDQGVASTVESVAPEQKPAEQDTPSTQQPELTIQDLGNLRAIIDVASQRGAFRAAEMQAVGASFNKLDTFLNAVAPQQQSAAEAPAA
jgi:hypothetical protein